jgi:hypothetical protein
MMTRMTGPTGLIPEQIWDGPPVPERGLEPGKPTGSAMPLVAQASDADAARQPYGCLHQFRSQAVLLPHARIGRPDGRYLMVLLLGDSILNEMM